MLVDALSSLPSIGKKSARKLAFFLLDQDQKYIHEFTNRIVNAKKNIKRCVACNNISLNSLCSICSNSNRDKSTLCVVPTTEDLDKIEFSGCYNGLYFVINGELTNKKSDMNLVEANIRVLANRIKDDSKIINLIIATNFSYSGEYTSEYIQNSLSDLELNIFRIGFGLPLNSSLDYADNETLKQAFINKRILKKGD
ncbi:MAG: recombination mediator RecR [Candidatus Ureaplasma intestinipullorum]|uniref:Recombination protein RecR n=1 Tax=Candidatus Ureaplasma intestinipullorum TaxID=2838770 RepID=A0A9E2NW13_9BACT|nr:recombination mediator RecR [Candidatus Ureaplasma intestinipullorum]